MYQFKLCYFLIWTVLPTFCRGEVLTQSFMIRLGELEQLIEDQKQTIDNLSMMMEDQEMMEGNIANLTSVIGDQKEEIANLTAVIEDQEKTIQLLMTDVYFKVEVASPDPSVATSTMIPWNNVISNVAGSDPSVAADTIITWNNVLSNVGGGYIDDAGSPDQYKFIAPISGTYQFIVTVMRVSGGSVYGSLIYKGNRMCTAYSSEFYENGICTRVIGLQVTDEVWVMNPSYGSNPSVYRQGYTTFSAYLIHADA